MQFNSFLFILVFFPITFVLYFLLNQIHARCGKAVLLAASLVFLAYADLSTLLVVGPSIVVNFLCAKFSAKSDRLRKGFVVAPVVINVGLLLYFKYLDFAIENVNFLFHSNISIRELALPIGISFFTFQQIAYVVSSYRGEITDVNFLDYLVYILYFPKFVMGPLMEPADFLKQIGESSRKKICWDNVASGIQIFSLGLFKKCVIADSLAAAVNWGFESLDETSALDLVLVVLFYTFEIYFDFSGYSDMAVGSSLLLNIDLPINFDSPYHALSIRDFWKRWHISLTKFFTKYLYIPLGGSRKGQAYTCINTMLVFLLSGMWHGANWTFLLWGALHGLFSLFDRFVVRFQEKIWKPIRWAATFAAVNILWLLFRADSIRQWLEILKRILEHKSVKLSRELAESLWLPSESFVNSALGIDCSAGTIRKVGVMLYLMISLAICLFFQNNFKTKGKHTAIMAIISAIAFVLGFISLSGESVFVYYNF